MKNNNIKGLKLKKQLELLQQHINLLADKTARDVKLELKDSDKRGTAFEASVKKALLATNGYISTPKNKVDIIKLVDGKRCNIEIKQGQGELERYNLDGKITTTIFDSDYIIYQPLFESDMDENITKNAYVFTSLDFLTYLYVNKLNVNRCDSKLYKSGKKRLNKWCIQSMVQRSKTTGEIKPKLYNTRAKLDTGFWNEYFTCTRLDLWLKQNNVRCSARAITE